MNNLELLVYLYNNEYLSLSSLIHLIEDLKMECSDLQSYKDKQKLLDDYLICTENQIDNPDLYSKITETFGPMHAEVRSVERVIRFNKFKALIKAKREAGNTKQ